MTKNTIWLVAVVFTALVQTTWPDFLKFQDVVPDLILLLVVYFALTDGEERAMWTGLVGGVYQDVASTSVLGHHVLCHVIIAFAVGRLSSRLITDHPAIKTVLVFVTGMVHGFIFTLIQFVQQPDIGVLYTIAAVVVPAAFYTAIITPLVYFPLGRLFPPVNTLQRGIA